MHFTFKYIGHHIEDLQGYLDFLFHQVWMKAEGDFEAAKLIAQHGEFATANELYDKYVELGNEEEDPDNKKESWAKFFNSSIENIYRKFLPLNEAQRQRMAEAYEANNNIEGLCTDKGLIPVTYAEIAVDHPELAKALKRFYSRIYGSKSPFNLKVFGFLNKELIGEYDTQFMATNNKGVCPFCGINHLKGNNHSYREAYDHYLPKALYPFNSLNFKNLAPMCHECNSTYKLEKVPVYKKDERNIDPLVRETQRTLAFFPYADAQPGLDFRLELHSKDIQNLTPKDITLTCSADGFDEQVQSWERVFGIDERYKALMCSEHAGMLWFRSVYEEFQNAKELSEIKEAKTYYDNVLKDASKDEYSVNGVLKVAFLERCKEMGVFRGLE